MYACACMCVNVCMCVYVCACTGRVVFWTMSDLIVGLCTLCMHWIRGILVTCVAHKEVCTAIVWWLGQYIDWRGLVTGWSAEQSGWGTPMYIYIFWSMCVACKAEGDDSYVATIKVSLLDGIAENVGVRSMLGRENHQLCGGHQGVLTWWDCGECWCT
jgi:hypothetical protein